MSDEEGVSQSNCVCIAETDKAILVNVPDEDKEVWVPKSMVHDDSEVYAKGHRGELVVKSWLANKLGWL